MGMRTPLAPSAKAEDGDEGFLKVKLNPPARACQEKMRGFGKALGDFLERDYEKDESGAGEVALGGGAPSA